MLCCTRNSGDPETTLQSLERIDDGSTRLGHAASILWASADGQDPAATSCIVLDRTECRCLSHSVRGRRYGRCFRHMVEGRRSMQVILRTNAVSCRAMPGAGVRGMGAITASAGPDMGVFTKKGPADSFWKRWLPPRDEGLVGPWHRVQVMRARDGFCDGERDAGSGGDARRSSTCIVIREGRGGRAQRRSTARHRTALGDRVFEDGRRSCGYHSASHNGVDVVVLEDRRLFACWLGPRGAVAAERPAPYALLAQRRPFQRRSPGQGAACSHEA